MLQTNDNVFRMWDAVIYVFDADTAKWKAFIPLANAAEKLRQLRQKSIDAGKRQQAAGEGTTRSKGSISDRMVALAALLLGNAHAWAIANGDTKLEVATDMADSTLGRKPDAERADAIDEIVTLLTPYTARMADYRVTDSDLKSLTTMAGDFRKNIGEQGGNTAGHKTATKTADDVRREGQLLLTKTVDKLMRNLKDTDPNFYSDYKNARVTRDLGGRHEG